MNDTYIPTVKDIVHAVDIENAQQDIDKLTPKQELFCRYYTEPGDYFSNKTTSYAKAYGYDLLNADTVRQTKTMLDKDGKEVTEEIQGTSELDKMYHYCQIAGSRLMCNDVIRLKVRALMVEAFNDDAIMDARLNEIALQGKDTDAIQAIKHRNDLKQRITKKLDVTTAGRPLAGLSDEELLKLAGE